MEHLHKLMQLREFFPTELYIWTDQNGLFHGKVHGNGFRRPLIKSHKKQFINELLEELNDEANVFLEKNVKET